MRGLRDLFGLLWPFPFSTCLGSTLRISQYTRIFDTFERSCGLKCGQYFGVHCSKYMDNASFVAYLSYRETYRADIFNFDLLLRHSCIEREYQHSGKSICGSEMH